MLYTDSDVTTIEDGVFIYEDSTLLTPVFASYLKYGNKIYSVDSEGKLTEFCNINGNC